VSEITLYVVEDADENTIAFDEGTMVYEEAPAEYGGRVVAREYEYSDSYIVPEGDYTGSDDDEAENIEDERDEPDDTVLDQPGVRQALRESHPDASPSEVLARAAEIAEGDAK
jgi:hypothetical protein